MKDDETGPGNPTPDLEHDANAVPMHHLFEIQLMINQIVGVATAENRANYAWMVKTQHVRRYLVNYYREHAALPTDRRYLGMTRPLNLEIGMVDLGAIRQKVRAESVTRNGLNVASPESYEDAPDHSLLDETEAGMPNEAAARKQNKVIFDLRQAQKKRGKKD